MHPTDAYGHYLFDLVEPGAYTLTAEMQGFARFLQENILVQNRGDVTVNVKLQLGALAETVKVTDAPVAVQFNTSGMDLTVSNELVKTLPIMARNPFTLALLDPAVVNRYTLERTPCRPSARYHARRVPARKVCRILPALRRDRVVPAALRCR